MRKFLMASAGTLALGVAGFAASAPTMPQPALAQSTMSQPMNSGMGDGSMAGNTGTEPHSNAASNLSGANTHTVYAPQLPVPDTGPDASPRSLLMAAQQALAAHKTGLAQEAMERAETGLLDRSVIPRDATAPSGQPAVTRLSGALRSLGAGDIAGAQHEVDDILDHMARYDQNMHGQMGQGGMGQNGMNPGMGQGGMSQGGM